MMQAISLAVLLALAGPANAADDALRTQVLDLLSGYEDTPTASELQKLGDGVDATLLAIASDSSVSRSRRASATWSLGFFPTDATKAYLVGLVADATADSQLRRSATWALCNGWGDAALDLVKPALDATDSQLRNQAVRAVAKVATPAARSVLEARLSTESSAMVRETLNQSLGELK